MFFTYKTTLIEAVIYLHMLIIQGGTAIVTETHSFISKNKGLQSYNYHSSKNLLFTPALYKCKPEEVATVILVFAGANRTSPSATIASGDVVILPSPPMTTNMDGPGAEGKATVECGGRMQRSTSNSSKGGRYLIVYGFIVVPCRISGLPCNRKH